MWRVGVLDEGLEDKENEAVELGTVKRDALVGLKGSGTDLSSAA